MVQICAQFLQATSDAGERRLNPVRTMESLVDRIQRSRSKPPTVGQTVAVGPVIEQAEVEIIDHPAVQQPGAGFVMAPKGQMVVNPLFAAPASAVPPRGGGWRGGDRGRGRGRQRGANNQSATNNQGTGNRLVRCSRLTAPVVYC